MYKNWWKILGAVLVVYSSIAGIAIPLRPGIENISYDKLSPNQNLEVTVNGYNTLFSEDGKSLKFYLQDETELLPATQVQAINNQLAKVTFALPASFHNSTLHLIGTGEQDGVISLSEAVIVDQAMVDRDKVLRKDELNIDQTEPKNFSFPYKQNLYETIRNLFFHVPMWFAMIVLFSVSVFYSIRVLSTNSEVDDLKAVQSVNVGVLFGILGIVTGAIWAKFTWGQAWSFDVKQNFAAIALLLYFAYLVLRNAIDEEQKRAKIAAIYNIFAFPMMVVLLFVLPRLSDSLHPGNGGNPGFNSYDLDSHMRLVFYPACLGWILVGYWIYTLLFRVRLLEKNNTL